MRSLTNRIVTFCRKQPDDRKYCISGEICFQFRFPLKPEDGYVQGHITKLRNLILEVDKEHPWEDIGPPLDPQKLESIAHLDDGEIHNQNFGQPEQWLWFRIFPGRDDVKKGQLYAYENYLGKLVSELAKKELPDGIFSIFNTFKVMSSKHADVDQSN